MNIGDRVTWTQTSQQRDTLSMTLRTGIIDNIADDVVTIKTARGKEQIALCRLRRPEQKSQITEFVEAMVQHSI